MNGEPADDRMELLEARLGVRFEDRGLLVRALTHGSAKSAQQPSNQRLEFLGDAVLGVVASAMIFARGDDLDEGRMTRIRARAVSRPSLVRIAEHWGLREHLIVGRMFDTPDAIAGSVLADAVEAIIAAVWLDGGFAAADAFVRRHFAPVIDRAAAEAACADAKSALGQWAQQKGLGHPRYRVDAVAGPDHALTFAVTAMLGGEAIACATGPSKKAAEQAAAKKALDVVLAR